MNPARKSVFEISSGNLRQLLRYMRDELHMPPDTIRLMIDGILRSFAIEDIYATSTNTQPEDPA